MKPAGMVGVGVALPVERLLGSGPAAGAATGTAALGAMAIVVGKLVAIGVKSVKADRYLLHNITMLIGMTQTKHMNCCAPVLPWPPKSLTKLAQKAIHPVFIAHGTGY